jgi:hypothetical protein
VTGTTRVLLPHVDHALQTEEGCGRGSGDAVLARARLRDDALLAHAHREQCLTQHVVDLVRTGVIEVLALEEDARAATVLLAEAHGLGEGAWATGVSALEPVEFGMERRIRHRLRERRIETVERCGEGFGHEATAVGTEMARRVGQADPVGLARRDDLASHARLSAQDASRR